MGKQNQGNGEKRLKPGHVETHRYGHLETKVERRTREANEMKKRVAELEHKVDVVQRVAASAINLLRPYATPDRKPSMPLRRTFQRAGKV